MRQRYKGNDTIHKKHNLGGWEDNLNQVDNVNSSKSSSKASNTQNMQHLDNCTFDVIFASMIRQNGNGGNYVARRIEAVACLAGPHVREEESRRLTKTLGIVGWRTIPAETVQSSRFETSFCTCNGFRRQAFGGWRFRIQKRSLSRHPFDFGRYVF